MQRYNDFEIKKNKKSIFAKKLTMKDFTSLLIVWYKENKRELPWRETKDPYKIWVSEIILQQTQVNQGIKYYYSFLKAFPSVVDLANAEEDRVLKIWQGLGYYTRARNMHLTAKKIKNELNGVFPKTYNDLLKLKGIGTYTAAAISSICYNEFQTVLDGNVYRVLSRIYGINTPINTAKGKKEFYEMAHSLNVGKDKGTFNQALMEYGAIHCTPKAPKCDSCVFESCYAYINKEVDTLPVKLSKIKVKKRYLNYFCILTNKEEIFIQKREDNDIWKGLYQFPLIETKEKVELQELLITNNFRTLIHGIPIHIVDEYKVDHQLSHQKLHINITTIKVLDEVSIDFLHVSLSQLSQYAFPVPLSDFIKGFDCRK